MLSYNRLDLAISGESFGRFLEIRFPLPFTLGGLVGVSWPLALELTGTSSNLSRFDGCLAAAEWLALMRATSFSKASDTWAVGGALRSPLFDEHSPKIVGIRGTGSREERARPVQTIVDECFLKNWFSKTSRWRRVRVSIAMLWRGVDGCGVKRRMMQLVNCSRFYTSWGRRGLRSCHNDWSLATSNRKKPPQLTRFRVSPGSVPSRFRVWFREPSYGSVRCARSKNFLILTYITFKISSQMFIPISIQDSVPYILIYYI